MNRRKFFNRIVLEEVDEGLLVQQGEEAYVARNWCLSAPVVELVETAIEAGLSWMIRDGHPRRNARWPNRRGVVYLALSPSEHQQWSVAIDGPVTFLCRSKCSFRPLFVRKRRGFSSPMLNAVDVDCRSR